MLIKMDYAESFCGKKDGIYNDEDYECISVTFDETVTKGVLTCIVDFFKKEEDEEPKGTFVFVENPRGKWDVAPKHIRELHVK